MIFFSKAPLAAAKRF